ncbi:MAG TPA: LD-carboxypeptidase [Burkholderiaceae bacterium]|nr:LD-carboxypeptidase [Burkholderiaceae bacterium]
MPAPPAAADVYLISPSGAVPDRERLQRAVERLQSLGLRARLDRDALARHQRFAGTDRARAAAFARAAAQPAPIVLITRGGYGITRILPALDYTAMAAAGKQWVGMSDFTAFQLAMLARANATTWTGPALLDDFGVDGDDGVDPTTAGTFADAMSGRLELLGFDCRGAPAGFEARGTLWGGNLSLVCALIGTPWMPRIRGGVLFVEEVNEHPYRIERMLTQLLHAGVLGAQKAVLIGYCTGYRRFEHDRGFDLAAVLRRLRGLTATPIIEGLPFGHASPKLTLPHGARIGLAVERRRCWLVLPHSHRRP